MIRRALSPSGGDPPLMRRTLSASFLRAEEMKLMSRADSKAVRRLSRDGAKERKIDSVSADTRASLTEPTFRRVPEERRRKLYLSDFALVNPASLCNRCANGAAFAERRRSERVYGFTLEREREREGERGGEREGTIVDGNNSVETRHRR